jgi:serine-type D-Ala-D-Ala carboxypeptidase (penicillin-binding protein 5/6)
MINTSTSLGVFFLTILTTFGVSVPFVELPNKQVEPPKELSLLDSDFTADSLLVFDLRSGDTLAKDSSETSVGIASLTKIMTGYIALNHLSPGSTVVVSVDAIETDGVVGHFQEGELFSLKDLMHAMMMSSSNDAAMAIAEAVGKKFGGTNYKDRISIFVHLMNVTATDLGMQNTVFQNPTGLDLDSGIPSNYSTANDLALLLKATENTPLLWESSRETERTIFSYTNIPHYIFNLNKLISSIPIFIGSKTGTTDASGESLIILYEQPLGSRKGFIMLGADKARRYLEAEALLLKVFNLST